MHRVYHNRLLALYTATALILCLYSWTHIDLNLTLINASWWSTFREHLIQLAYFNRPLSTAIFILIIIVLTALHIIVIKKHNTIPWKPLLIITSIFAFFSYPFLSHDIFNYIFDAKILTFYHQNPYLHKALDFPSDPMLGFMHWTHRTYPYGPTFLLITLLPSFLSFGKFLLALVLFKIVWIGIFVYTAQRLYMHNKVWGILFATQPLVLVEGLMNMHNDMIALCLGLLGAICMIERRSAFVSYAYLAASAGIKYMTIPFILVSEKKSWRTAAAFFGVGLLIMIASLQGDVQPWYFLSLFLFIPWYTVLLKRWTILLSILLLAYIPYILYGEGVTAITTVKHTVALCVVILGILVYPATQRSKI